jgi:tol-pal system protein YbgF
MQVDEQEQELRTLRGQLALARAEVREFETDVRKEPAALKGTVSGGETLPWAKTEKSQMSMEPVLRLNGEVVDERLATTADVPDLPLFEEPEPTPDAVPERESVNIEGYRRGLDLIRQQRFADALVELDTFASAHPGHPYADNALFWCGEIHYLRREYGEALEYFSRLEKLHPWGNKTADALYRMGQIYLRRGDTKRARAYFEEVRERFPDTAAARLALREDAS